MFFSAGCGGGGGERYTCYLRRMGLLFGELCDTKASTIFTSSQPTICCLSRNCIFLLLSSCECQRGSSLWGHKAINEGISSFLIVQGPKDQPSGAGHHKQKYSKHLTTSGTNAAFQSNLSNSPQVNGNGQRMDEKDVGLQTIHSRRHACNCHAVTQQSSFSDPTTHCTFEKKIAGY